MPKNATTIDTEGISKVTQLLSCPNFIDTLFEPSNIERNDKKPIDDGFLWVMNPTPENSKNQYRLYTQVKTTTQKDGTWINNKKLLIDNAGSFFFETPIKAWHLNMYSTYKAGFLFFAVYIEDGKLDNYVIFWEWKNSEQWLEEYRQARIDWQNTIEKEKSVNWEDFEYKVRLKNSNRLVEKIDREKFYSILLPKIVSSVESYSHPMILENLNTNRPIIEQLTVNQLESNRLENSITGLFESFNSVKTEINKIHILSRIFEIIQENDISKLNIVNCLVDNLNYLPPKDLLILLRVLISLSIESNLKWLKFSKIIKARFNKKQELLDPLNQLYSEQGIEWINVKFAYLNWLTKSYEHGNSSQKSNIEKLVTELINKTTYSQLKEGCLRAIKRNFEQLPTNFQSVICKIAASESYTKVTVSEFLSDEKIYLKEENRNNALELIKKLLNGKSTKPEYINYEISTSWRGDKYDLRRMGDNIYYALARNIPKYYQTDDLWIEILLSGFTKNFRLSANIFDGDENSLDLEEKTENTDTVLDGYITDKFSFGFNIKEIKADFKTQEGQYRWFVLFKEFITGLNTSDRDTFIDFLLNNSEYKRESIYFTIFKTYQILKFQIPEELEKFFYAYNEMYKKLYCGTHPDDTNTKDYIANYSLEGVWEKDWIGFAIGETRYVDPIKDLIDSGGSEWENFIGFTIEVWIEKLKDRLENGLRRFGFENEHHTLPALLEKVASQRPNDIARNLINWLEKFGETNPVSDNAHQNNSKLISSWIYHLIYGILHSNIESEDKFLFSTNLIDKSYFTKDTCSRVIEYWRGLVDSDKLAKEDLIRLKDILIQFVKNHKDPEYDRKKWTSSREYNSGYELTSVLINSNIGSAWILLGSTIYNKLPDYIIEIQKLMKSEFDLQNNLVCSAILYCFIYNAISTEMWDIGGIVHYIIDKTLDAENIIEDGRLEFVLLIFNRIKSKARNDQYKTRLHSLAKELFDYKKLYIERPSFDILNHINIYFGIFDDIYNEYLGQQENLVFKSTLLHIFASYADDYRIEITRKEQLDSPNIPNHTKSRKRLTERFNLLLDWQNSHFENNPQLIGQEEKAVTTASFGKFFDPIQNANNINEILDFYNFWGDDILEKILRTPYQYFIRLYGNKNFLSRLVDFNHGDTDRVLEQLLSKICKNKYFMNSDSYSIEPIFNSLDYLIDKESKVNLIENKVYSEMFENLYKYQGHNSEAIKLIGKYTMKIDS